MPRIWFSWFSGPRIFSGLIRPGISFSTNELKGKPSRKREDAPSPDNHEPQQTDTLKWARVADFAFS